MVKLVKIAKRALPFILCAAIIIGVTVTANIQKKHVEAQAQTVLTVWQIDSFEGGKGSRSSYIQKVGNDFTKKTDCFINVTSLTAEAARTNLKNGVAPDLISYGAGTYGLENYITGYRCWCNGGYCILTLDGQADFSDVSAENTVVNAGTGNLSSAAALFEELSGAAIKQPTAAYVSLLNGEFKYLFGTQRDVFRLKTREATFSIKPVESFNDLYQNISVVTTDKARAALAQKFVDYLCAAEGLEGIGMMRGGSKLYGDEMSKMENVNYGYKLCSPLSESAFNEVKKAVENCDLKLLKNLLK